MLDSHTIAYEFSKKAAWWNKSVDCGPIVEQATHFVDLSRFFGGEVDMESIMAHSVEWYEEPGKLTKAGYKRCLGSLVSDECRRESNTRRGPNPTFHLGDMEVR